MEGFYFPLAIRRQEEVAPDPRFGKRRRSAERLGISGWRMPGRISGESAGFVPPLFAGLRLPDFSPETIQPGWP
jgi:hypothetical protein